MYDRVWRTSVGPCLGSWIDGGGVGSENSKPVLLCVTGSVFLDYADICGGVSPAVVYQSSATWYRLSTG
jgi:hypothetical protein